MAKQETALRKRQQIANANRTMFLWVAAVSVVVGFSIVGSVFLFQKAMFNEKVLSVKQDTSDTLRDNIKVIPELEDQIRVLNTNDALRSTMQDGQDRPIRVVLDALPSDANSSALGASLQQRFLNDPTLRIESLSVDPIAGVESLDPLNIQNAAAPPAVEGEEIANQITFRFEVSSGIKNANALKDLLRNLERSIRAIDIVSLEIETQGNRIVLSVEGKAFYEPAKTVELKDETVKP